MEMPKRDKKVSTMIFFTVACNARYVTKAEGTGQAAFLLGAAPRHDGKIPYSSLVEENSEARKASFPEWKRGGGGVQKPIRRTKLQIFRCKCSS
ncbi:hypothetical protein AVEN_265949-1 [Araneus ventricosus]|uniref:Uncharacterized protein n=1 Tax=Araneus ventricosus TaxID=182803 RepID=A0A4Y2F6K1_ARAVE|nr:hypothetical protein AVEN_265949-1 [Araneus ventricosus]